MDYRDLQVGSNKKHFWFTAKNDLINVLMKKGCKDRKQLRILDIGVGVGDDLMVLNKFGDTYVIDADEAVLSVIDKRLYKEKKIADACILPYADDFFDVVVSFDVFEHIKNDRKAIGEAYRVLKEGGVFMFTVPAFQFLFSSHDRALDHQRRYDKKSIKALLSSFANTKIFFWNSVLFIPAAIVRLARKKAKPRVDQMNLPSLANALFLNLLKIDNALIEKGISMPFGLSIVGFGYKKPTRSVRGRFFDSS